MRIKIDMQEVANTMHCIVNYEQMAWSFTQMVGGKDSGPLREFWNTKVVKRETSTLMTQSEYDQWCDINLHLVTQTWGNTSGGWEGIGGSAMTNSYTLIIENKWYGLSCIYYDGKLAYICEMDEKYMEYVQKGYRGLPGYGNCTEKLTVIFKKPIR